MTRIFLFTFLLVATQATAQTLTGRVIKVADGDTFTLLTADKEQIRIRLHGIDAPEKAQPFSHVSRQFLNDKVYGKNIEVQKMDVEQYGRTIGMVFIDSVNVNEALLQAGLAWHYKKYDKNPDWAKMEEVAKRNRVGLWVEDDAVAPWEWRKAQRAGR